MVKFWMDTFSNFSLCVNSGFRSEEDMVNKEQRRILQKQITDLKEKVHWKNGCVIVGVIFIFLGLFVQWGVSILGFVLFFYGMRGDEEKMIKDAEFKLEDD